VRTPSNAPPKAMTRQGNIKRNSTYEKYFSIEKYITYIPLLAATIALSFDVGFFYAIEINFFTLFSLSEHILFVLQALPAAIVLLFVVAILLPVFSYEPKKHLPQAPPTMGKYKRIAAIVAVAVLVVGLISFVAYIVWTSEPLARLFTIFISVFIIPPFIALQFAEARFRQLRILTTAILICVVISFAFGMASGAGLRNSNTINVVKLKANQSPIIGVVIRSGERGVLLYERTSNLVRFEPWEAINSIEAPATEIR
jgi:hypothetical protein